ncbi:MAG TPA: response regulator [Caulobacteraceae bacterium]|jgi:CheY-like chemotaxis protein
MNSRELARHTPYLRRYARALTGSQAQGDSYVQTTLQRLLSRELELEPGMPARAALFRAFQQTWSRSLNGHGGGAGSGADRRLQGLSREYRSVLLLVLMEGFSLPEAAMVLDRTAEQTEALLEAAQREVERQLATQVLIIEDEPIVALDLERMVRDLGHDLAGVASTHDEAVSLARGAAPGLVLADVRLADGSSGLDAVSDILESFDIPVIFITAFPERLLTGEGAEPAFLVTKPFREEAVKALIGQALFFHHPSTRTGAA